MTPIARVLESVFENADVAKVTLRLSDVQYDGLVTGRIHVRHWLMSILVNDYGVNPLYLVGVGSKMMMDG